jgi:hypothetical protein
MNTEILEVEDLEFGYTEFFVNGTPVSQYRANGMTTPSGNFELYEVTDYLDGFVYNGLFKDSAERLARQIARAQAYVDSKSL